MNYFKRIQSHGEEQTLKPGSLSSNSPYALIIPL